MKSYWVYILLCSDNSFYTGMTNNLDNRIAQHQEGTLKTAYTFSRRPVELVFGEAFTDVNMAIEWEKKIKVWSRAKKIALIEQNWDSLKKLSVCQNPTRYIHGKTKLE